MKNNRRGIAIVIVLFVLLLIGILVFSLTTKANQSRALVYKNIDRYISKLAAESILAIASSSVVQSKVSGNFVNRWYKKTNFRGPDEVRKKQGYVGKITGKIKIVSGIRNVSVPYTVIGEDIPGPASKPLSKNPTPKELYTYGTLACYYRTDLFARVTYGSEKLVLYSPLVVHPEEKIYNVKNESKPDPSDPSKINYKYVIDQKNLR